MPFARRRSARSKDQTGAAPDVTSECDVAQIWTDRTVATSQRAFLRLCVSSECLNE